MTSHDETSAAAPGPEQVEMPATTVWPMVLALGVALLAVGLGTTLVLSAVGIVLFLFGLVGWIAQLLPGRGHVHEPLVEPERRPRPVAGTVGAVEQLRPGMPGYRMRLPTQIHPISAGIKGGIVGGLVMPIPALMYGVLSGHGPWFPVNLLAGMIIPGLGKKLSVAELEQFNLGWLVVAVCIHAVISVSVGLLYGVLLPTFPTVPGGPVFASGVVLPLIWTGASYGFMGIINPALQEHVDWPWFIVSQIVYGVAAALVVIRSEKVAVPPAGSGAEQPL